MGKTIIIGGGVAGLTAGIYCRIAGLDCVIVEKNNFTGGNLTGWMRDGYEIDNCMHWLNGTRKGSEYNKMWRTVGMLGDDLPIIKSEFFYTSEYKGKRMTMWRDPDRTLSEMINISPEDAAESERFTDTVKLFSNRCYTPTPAKIIAGLYYAKLNLGELALRFKNRAIRNFMTDYFGYDFSALSLIFCYASFISGDADLPHGGSRAAAKRIEKKFLDLGGRIITGESVTGIKLEGDKATGVKLSDGRSIRAERIIVACDPRVVFGRLIPEETMPAAMRTAYRKLPLFSAIQAAFSCNITDELPKGSVIFDISPINFDGREVGRMIIKPYTSGMADIPNGRAVLQTIFYLYDREAERWIALYKNKKAYNDLKEKFGNAVKRRILNRFPSLTGSLKLLDVWTPATYKRYFNSTNGAFMSFAMLPGIPMIYHSSPRAKGLSNVYIASQWQSNPGGLPVAAMNGKKTALVAISDAVKESRKAYAKRVGIYG